MTSSCFVHGFYNTFQDAIFRTAQLHHDLDFAGQSVAFSWPSAGSMSAYESDQKNSDLSVDALIEAITTVAGTLKKTDGRRSKIHVIAHSMGNRILLQAMYRINLSPDDDFDESPFGQVVLAAPDVGAIMFNNLSPHVVRFECTSHLLFLPNRCGVEHLQATQPIRACRTIAIL